MIEIKVEDAREISRRKFLTRLSLWSGAFAASIVAVPFAGALLDPLLNDDTGTWRAVGRADDFVVGSTNMVVFTNTDPKPYGGVVQKTAAWLRREKEDHFIAFSANCTHLGCPVRWEEEAHLFMCPCHGGVYNEEGDVAAGPPPQPLRRYEVRIRAGKVEVKTAPVPLTDLTAAERLCDQSSNT